MKHLSDSSPLFKGHPVVRVLMIGASVLPNTQDQAIELPEVASERSFSAYSAVANEPQPAKRSKPEPAIRANISVSDGVDLQKSKRPPTTLNSLPNTATNEKIKKNGAELVKELNALFQANIAGQQLVKKLAPGVRNSEEHVDYEDLSKRLSALREKSKDFKIMSRQDSESGISTAASSSNGSVSDPTTLSDNPKKKKSVFKKITKNMGLSGKSDSPSKLQQFVRGAFDSKRSKKDAKLQAVPEDSANGYLKNMNYADLSPDSRLFRKNRALASEIESSLAAKDYDAALEAAQRYSGRFSPVDHPLHKLASPTVAASKSEVRTFQEWADLIQVLMSKGVDINTPVGFRHETPLDMALRASALAPHPNAVNIVRALEVKGGKTRASLLGIPTAAELAKIYPEEEASKILKRHLKLIRLTPTSRTTRFFDFLKPDKLTSVFMKKQKKKHIQELNELLDSPDTIENAKKLHRFACRFKDIFRYERSFQMTPFLMCLKKGHFNKAFAIIDLGVDVKAKNYFRETAFHVLSYIKRPLTKTQCTHLYKMARLLLANGVNLYDVNIKGQTVFDLLNTESEIAHEQILHVLEIADGNRRSAIKPEGK